MGSKKRIIYVSISVILLVSMLLCIFVFMAVKETKINFVSSSNLNQVDLVAKLNASNVVPYGVSTLFINRDDIAEKVENIIPILKVKNVEVEFPNIIKINCEERKEAFALVLNDKTLILDEEFKILMNVNKDSDNAKDLVQLQISDELIQDKDIWLTNGQVQFTYLNDCLQLLQLILLQYQGFESHDVFCNHFLKMEIKQGFKSNGEKCVKVIFHLANLKKVEFEDPLEKMDKRVGILMAIIGDSDINQEEIVLVS